MALENAANGDLLKSYPENLVTSTCRGYVAKSILVSSASSGERPKAAAMVVLPGFAGPACFEQSLRRNARGATSC